MVCGLVLLLCLGAPIAGGLDAHFYSLDLVAFIALLLTTITVGDAAARSLAQRYFSHHSPQTTDDAKATASSVVDIEEPIAESAETAEMPAIGLRNGLNRLLAVLVPVCVIIGCASPSNVCAQQQHACARVTHFTAPHLLPANTQILWLSSRYIRACSTMPGVSSFASWATPFSWRSASSG